MTKAFKGIVAGLEDAIAFAQGDSTRGRVARRGAPIKADAKRHRSTHGPAVPARSGADGGGAVGG